MLREIVLALALPIFGYFTYKFVKWAHFFYFYQVQPLKDLPGPDCLPIIGCLHKLPIHLSDLPEFLLKEAKKARDQGWNMLKLWTGPIMVVMPINHETVKDILNSNELQKGNDYRFFEQWLGAGLLLGTGERWKKARKLTTPVFHFTKLEEYSQTIDFHCRTLVNILSKKPHNTEVDLYNLIKFCALDIITDTTLGVQIDAQQNTEHPYVKAVEKFNRIACHRSLKIYLHPQFVWWISGYAKEANEATEVLHSFVEKVIKDRVDEYKANQNWAESSKIKLNFLDQMLQSKDLQQMSEQHMREEINTIVFAGHDTTAHAVSWTIWCLATHPQVQQRVYDELIENFGGTDSDFCTPKLQKLKYLDQCFKEALRLYPSVPLILRYLNNDLMIGGRKIPKSTSITIPIILIHRNPNVFPEPNKFDPDRFAADKEYPAYSYIPFSAGLRNCVGQKFAQIEAKIMIAHLLHNFKIETDKQLDDNEIQFEVVLKPKIGVPVRLVKRNN